MNRLITGAFVVAGLGITAWQLDLAIQAIMVFRTGEPITSWVSMLLAPVFSLIGSIATMFNKKLGAYWFIAGALIALFFFVGIEKGLTENGMAFLVRISIPMLVIGCGILVWSYTKKVRT